MKRIILLLCIMPFLCVAQGCRAEQEALNTVQGKFVFLGYRDYNFGFGTYFLKDTKIKLIAKKVAKARWSPDGKLIATTTWGTIFIYDEEGNQRDEIKTKYDPKAISWAPDGKEIAYIANEDFPGTRRMKRRYLYRYNLETKKHSLVYMGKKGDYFLKIQYSPKGDRILFSNAETKFDNEGIYLVNLNGNNLRRVSKRGSDVSWYPDGVHICYNTNMDESGEIIKPGELGDFYKMNVDTGETEILFSQTRWVASAKISRDGKYLYGAAGGFSGGYIFIMPLEGPDKGKYIKVTQRVPYNDPSGDKTVDADPDWYQGE